MYCAGTLSSEFENVTATCGVCTSTAVCGGSGTEASSILVSSRFVMLVKCKEKVGCYIPGMSKLVTCIKITFQRNVGHW